MALSGKGEGGERGPKVGQGQILFQGGDERDGGVRGSLGGGAGVRKATGEQEDLRALPTVIRIHKIWLHVFHVALYVENQRPAHNQQPYSELSLHMEAEIDSED